MIPLYTHSQWLADHYSSLRIHVTALKNSLNLSSRVTSCPGALDQLPVGWSIAVLWARRSFIEGDDSVLDESGWTSRASLISKSWRRIWTRLRFSWWRWHVFRGPTVGWRVRGCGRTRAKGCLTGSRSSHRWRGHARVKMRGLGQSLSWSWACQ